MVTNVEVQKNPNENSSSLIRRFTRRVQGSGILRRVRGIRYHARSTSPLIRKKKKIVSLRKKAKFEELVKLGKASENVPRKRFRR